MHKPSPVHTRERQLSQLMLIWFGAIVGLSFIATPAKFLVPELDMATAIRVGRATFDVFFYFECAMTASIALILMTGRTSLFSVAYCVALITLYSGQQGIVLPAVQSNTDSLFSGYRIDSRFYHHAFIFLEGMKAVILVSYLPALSYYRLKTLSTTTMR